MCIFYSYVLFLIVILHPVLTTENDISLHYANRVVRAAECGDDEEPSSGGLFASLFSVILFLIYIMILLGLTKACIGLCCSPPIGIWGLHLLIDMPEYSVESYDSEQECGRPINSISKSTEFCLNVVFFLCAPFVILQSLCSCERPFMFRDSQSSMKKGARVSCSDMRRKAGMDVYREDDEAENQDTVYVLQQLHRSEQSLVYGTMPPMFVDENLNFNEDTIRDIVGKK